MRTPNLLSGVVWSTLNAAFAIGLPFVMFVVFSRLVPPWQIGVMAFALAAAELLKAFCPQGLYEVLVKPGATPEQDRAAFGWLLAAGVVGALLFVLVIRTLAGFWDELHRVWPFAAALCARVLFDLALIQPQAVLARRAAFRLLAGRAIASNLSAGAVALVLIGLEGPLWGMAGYYVVQSALAFLFTVLGARALPRPSLSVSALGALAREAGFASGVRLVAAANNYLDQILIAAFVPARLIAEFNLAKRVESILFTTAMSFSGVLFQPAFAVQHPDLRGRLLSQGRAALTVLCALPVAVFVADHRSLVEAVFGAQWTDAAPIAALMAVGGLARVYGSLPSALLSVSGRNGALFGMAAAMGVVGVSVVVLAGASGLWWVAIGLTARNVLALVWQTELTRADQPRPLAALAGEVVLPFGAMVAAAAAGALAVRGFHFEGPLLKAAAEASASGVAAGLVCLAFTGKRLLTLVDGRKAPVAEGAQPCA